MASEIQLAYGTTGRTLYAVIRTSVGTVWNTNSAAFEAFNAANWTDYDIAMTEQGTTGYYAGTFPPAISSGVYEVEVRDRGGSSPAVSDALAGSGEIQWSGTAVVSLASLIASIVAGVFAFVTEGAFTFVEILRGMAAFVMGKASGGNTAAPVFRDLADTKDRIAMTTDTDGNRTAVSRDLT